MHQQNSYHNAASVPGKKKEQENNECNENNLHGELIIFRDKQTSHLPDRFHFLFRPIPGLDQRVKCVVTLTMLRCSEIL